MTDLVDLITNVGFPIGMCLLIYVDLRTKLERIIEILISK